MIVTLTFVHYWPFYSIALSFNDPTYLDSSVSFSYFLCVKGRPVIGNEKNRYFGQLDHLLKFLHYKLFCLQAVLTHLARIFVSALTTSSVSAKLVVWVQHCFHVVHAVYFFILFYLFIFLIFSGICVFSCKCFLVRSKNFLAMLILTLYENSGLYQTFLTCFVVYLRYCDLSYKTYLLRVSTILGNIVVVIGGYIENVHITGIDGDTF